MSVVFPTLYDFSADISDLYLTAYLFDDGSTVRARSQTGIEAFTPIDGAYQVTSGITFTGFGLWVQWDNNGDVYAAEMLVPAGFDAGVMDSMGLRTASLTVDGATEAGIV